MSLSEIISKREFIRALGIPLSLYTLVNNGGPGDRKKVENKTSKNSSYSLNIFRTILLYHLYFEQWLDTR